MPKGHSSFFAAAFCVLSGQSDASISIAAPTSSPLIFRCAAPAPTMLPRSFMPETSMRCAPAALSALSVLMHRAKRTLSACPAFSSSSASART